MYGYDDSRASWAAERYRARVQDDLRHGAVAGLLGGGAIILFFAAYDALLFSPLATPNLLSQMLPKSDGLSEVLIDPEALLADVGARLSFFRMAIFTALHLGAFTVLGIALVKLLSLDGVVGGLLVGGLYGLVACSLGFLAALHLSGAGLAANPVWPAVLLGNFVAGMVMGGYLELKTFLKI
jgi:hypothetical protein